MSTPRRLLAWFVALLLAGSALAYLPILRAGTLGAGGGLWVFALMWVPGIAALLSRLAVQGDLRGMGFGLPTRTLAFALLVPVASALLVYGLVWGSGLGGFDATPLARLGSGPRFLFSILLGLAAGLLFATGEELGWRGLLLPELAKLVTPVRAAVISGVVWALYHYPAMLFTDYRSAATLPYAMSVFTLSVFAVSFLMAWMRLHSRSLWPAALFHASHNFFVQDVFDRLTVNHPVTPYLTTEFGAGLCIAYASVAIWLWRRHPPPR